LVEVVLTGLGGALVRESRASAVGHGLAIGAAIPDRPVVVETDRTRVRQILGNLLSNAIKYTSRGSITLAVGRMSGADADDAHGWAYVSVADTGRGIPEEKRQSIFEEFIRLDEDETTGAGLGLAISQRLTEALGGRITVDSEVGRGSTFTLMLPAPTAAPAEAATLS
jgi:signal transduction histidine kinase